MCRTKLLWCVVGVLSFSCMRPPQYLEGLWKLNCSKYAKAVPPEGLNYDELIAFNADGVGWCNNTDMYDTVVYFRWYLKESAGKIYLYVLYPDSCQETYEVRLLRGKRLQLGFLGSSRAPYFQCNVAFTGIVRYPHCYYTKIKPR